MDNLRVLEVGQHIDARGILHFLNDINEFVVRRVYLVQNSEAGKSRGWHGHKYECKLFFPIEGKFRLALVQIDDFQSPNRKLIPKIYELSSTEPFAVSITGGFANNLTSITENARIMVFSNFTVHESENDDFRYPPEYWNTL
jgi:dTDP-4-dehydrorhamnose 3,5-epimerase